MVGRNPQPTYKIALQLEQEISRIPGAADVHIHQVVDAPEIRLNVDRVKAGQVGLTQRDVTNSLLISLSSSGQVAPNQWLNWANGVNYTVAVQTPQYRIDSMDALLHQPISPGGGSVMSNTPNSIAGTAADGRSAGVRQPGGHPGPGPIAFEPDLGPARFDHRDRQS